MTVPVSRDIVLPESGALRLRNLFVFCFHEELDGIQIMIMRVLNLDHYFAFTGFDINDDTKMYYLTQKQISKLRNSKLKTKDLLSDKAGWESLYTLEQKYSGEDIDDFIRAAVKKGLTLQDLGERAIDCLINYDAMQDIRIVRKINSNQYFAVLSADEKDMSPTMLRALDQEQVDKLRDNKITRYELLGKIGDWVSVEKYDRGSVGSTVRTFTADVEAEGFNLKEYLVKRAFPLRYDLMEVVRETEIISDFLRKVKFCSKEMRAAKNRKIIAIIVVAGYVLFGCMTPAIFDENELLFIGIELFYVAVTLLVYFAAERRAFKKFLKRMETDGITENTLVRSNRACEKMYREYPCRKTLKYIKNYNPQAVQSILASLKKK